MAERAGWRAEIDMYKQASIHDMIRSVWAVGRGDEDAYFGRYMEGKEKQQVAFIPFLPSKLVMVCGFFLSPLLPTAVL